MGGWKDAERFEGARFCVLDEVPDGGAPADAHVPIYDPAAEAPLRENLERLVTLVDDARAGGKPVLLYCGHGVRRGPLAGAWYLHRHNGISLDEAYRRVAAVRPKIEHAKEWIAHPQPLVDRETVRRRAK